MLDDPRALSTLDVHLANAAPALGLGPEPSDPALTAVTLHEAFAKRRGPIKPVLLDQRVIAGLGNIYAAESLWRARISPFAPCNALRRPQITKLRKAIDAVLVRATGSRYTDDDTVTLDVYDREGLPCRRCGTTIERAVQAGRSTYYCPQCQPAAAPKAVSATKGKRPRPAR